MTFMNKPALHKMWVLDAQWTDIPKEIEQIVKDLWGRHELGNDVYMLRRSINDLLDMEENFESENFVSGEGWVKTRSSLTPLVEYLREKGVADNEDIIIHWWW